MPRTQVSRVLPYRSRITRVLGWLALFSVPVFLTACVPERAGSTPVSEVENGAFSAASAEAAEASPPTADPVAPHESVRAALYAARDSLRMGGYDASVQILKPALDRSQGDETLLRDVYLMLIQTYFYAGNYFKSEPQGREISELFYREGRRYAEECLSVPGLRHLRPESPAEYPPEMIECFRRIRSERLGDLRIQSIRPSDAIAVLDGDTLRPASAGSEFLEPPSSVGSDSSRGAEQDPSVPTAIGRDIQDTPPNPIHALDLPVGRHSLLLLRPGYRDLREIIEIRPGSVTERTFEMRRNKGPLWYGTRGAVLVGGVVAYLVTRDDPDKSSGVPPLPEPPAPPQ